MTIRATTRSGRAAEKLIKVDYQAHPEHSVEPSQCRLATVCEKYQAFYMNVGDVHADVLGSETEWSADMFFAPGRPLSARSRCAAQPEADRPTKWGLILTDDVDGQALAKAAVVSAEKTGPTSSSRELTGRYQGLLLPLLKMKQAA